EDHEDAVAVADLADTLEVPGHGRHRASGRADYRLRQERHDGFLADLDDFVFELVGDAPPIFFRALVGQREVILEAGIDELGVDDQWFVGCATPVASPCAEGAKRVPVIAETPGDHPAARNVAPLEMELPGELHGSFNRLGPAARIPDAVERTGSLPRNHLSEFFRLGRREEAGVHIFEARRLFGDGGGDFGMTVAEARDRSATARIDVAIAVCIHQVNALALRGDRQACRGRALKNMPPVHSATLTSATAAAISPLFF